MPANTLTSVYRYDLIAAAMTDQKRTNNSLARSCGLAVATVSSIRNGRLTITLPSLIKVAEELGLTMQELFEPKVA